MDMIPKQDKDLVAYLRSIVSGPCMAITVHGAVVEGSSAFGLDRLDLWRTLKEKFGEQESQKSVRFWIDNPYQLTKSRTR